jgi:hypothetical protein
VYVSLKQENYTYMQNGMYKVFNYVYIDQISGKNRHAWDR